MALSLLLAALYVAWSWSGELGGLGADPSVYMLSARHYAPYLAHDPVAAAIARHTQFPPLYPIVLVLTGAATSVPLAHAVTALLVAAAAAAAYAWLRVLGLGAGTAVLGSTVFALAPGTWSVALVPGSEALFVALALAAFAVLGAPDTPRRRVAAGLLLTAALLTRTAGVALLAAWLVASRRRRSGGMALATPAIAAPAALWGMIHRPEWNYGDDLARSLQAPPALDTLAQNLAALARGTADALAVMSWQYAIAAAFMMFAVICTLVRFARREPDAWFAVAYVAMLSVWPYPEEARRFAWPLLPFLVGHGLWGAARLLAGRVPRLRFIQPAALVAGAVLLAPGPALTVALNRWTEAGEHGIPALRQLPVWYIADRATAERHGRVHVAISRALGELNEHVAAGDCVVSIVPPVVAFHAGRDGVTPPPAEASDVEFRQGLSSSGCPYVLLMAATGKSYPLPFYPGDLLIGHTEALRLWTLDGGPPAQDRVVAVLVRNPYFAAGSPKEPA